MLVNLQCGLKVFLMVLLKFVSILFVFNFNLLLLSLQTLQLIILLEF